MSEHAHNVCFASTFPLEINNGFTNLFNLKWDLCEVQFFQFSLHVDSRPQKALNEFD